MIYVGQDINNLVIATEVDNYVKSICAVSEKIINITYRHVILKAKNSHIYACTYGMWNREEEEEN